MRIAYRALALTIVALVAVQAAAHAWASAGIGTFVQGGGVIDLALMESGELPFTEVLGLMVHGMNGMFVIPAVALLLLVVSFFARLPRGIAWAGIVLALVALQVTLGLLGHGLTVLGLLHGFNAIILASAAMYAQSLAARPDVRVQSTRYASGLVNA